MLRGLVLLLAGSYQRIWLSRTNSIGVDRVFVDPFWDISSRCTVAVRFAEEETTSFPIDREARMSTVSYYIQPGP